jgi:SAM-dependent methyltransferase
MRIIDLIKQRLKQNPLYAFHSNHYMEHNKRRQEHLASLGLEINGCSVLEVGAGIGDHTKFFIDRGCSIVTSDGRKKNIELLCKRYPDINVLELDLDNLPVFLAEKFDIVYCYGLLYHLRYPTEAINFLSKHCKKMFLLETLVSFGDTNTLNPCREDQQNPTQAISGIGCRPTRRWVFNRLKDNFEFVYMPLTQPYHKEFPVDWETAPSSIKLARSIFIGSRYKINNELITEEIPMKQKRYLK